MAKRAKLTEHCAEEYITESIVMAMEESFPWAGAFASPVKDYIETVAKAKNAPPEFVLMGLLVSTSAVMGPAANVQPFPGYQEPVNLFTLCVGPSGSGKSQSLKLSVEEPIRQIVAGWNEHVIVDDFTREGFRKHLLANSGRVILVSDEVASMFDNLDKKGAESNADRHLFCRLFDSGSWTRTTGQGNSLHRERINRTHCAFFGFIQPHPFISKILPTIVAEKDGLYDRFLISCPKVQRLSIEEARQWNDKRKELPPKRQDFTALLQIINDWHDCVGPREYILSADASALFSIYDAEQVQHFNATWGMDIERSSTKDARHVLRLSAVIHVLTTAFTAQTLVTDGPHTPLLCNCIPAQAMQTAIALANYCSEQRRLLQEALQHMEVAVHYNTITPWTLNELQEQILLCPGPFATVRMVQRKASKPQQGFVHQNCLKVFQDMQAVGLGKLAQPGRGQSVLYKLIPVETNKEAIERHLGKKYSWEDYKAAFLITPTALLTAHQFNSLLHDAPDKDELAKSFGINYIQ